MKRAFRGSRSQAGAPFFCPGDLVFCATARGSTMEFLVRDGSPGSEAYPKCSAAVQFNFLETAIFA
ncbi:MAG: hypothetical protein DMG34_08205 [Acidobacteria bacterium]|nr:MAG: hypothetical protein DMG34_08205 [Acidobacteriota bacterium]